MDFTNLIEQGPMVAAMAVAVLYFYRREVRTDNKVDGYMKKCEEREAALAGRLQIVEDRLYVDGQNMLKTCSDVIERLTKSETDRHRAIQGDRS